MKLYVIRHGQTNCNKENKKSEKGTYISEGMCIGMSIGLLLGNLFDRIFYGYVIDYLDFRIFNYNFPIFNISDICICIGIFLMIIEVVKEDKNASR